jgi:integrase/recombinase XerC
METAPEQMTVIRLHLDWFDRSGATPVSVQHRRENLQRLARWLEKPLLHATADDLDRWQSAVRARRNSRGHTLALSTVATYTAHVRAFYGWAVRMGHLDIDPTARLPRIKLPRATAHPVPERDLMVALEVAQEPLRTWLVLAAFMGLRAMEIASITREDIHEVRGRLVLSGIGKGNKPYSMTVPVHVEPSLRRYLNTRGPLWSAPRGGPLRPKRLSCLVSRWFRRQDMPYTLHWLRHSFGSEFYAATRDVLLTQDAMRHASPDTTRIYVQTSPKAMTAAMDRLSKAVAPKPPTRRRAPKEPVAEAA